MTYTPRAPTRAHWVGVWTAGAVAVCSPALAAVRAPVGVWLSLALVGMVGLVGVALHQLWRTLR